jgi:hypothetical protein
VKRSYIRRELQKVDSSENPTVVEPVIQGNTKKNRTRRLQRNIGVVGHEERIEDDGTIVYKERLRPVNSKRIRRKPRRFDDL